MTGTCCRCGFILGMRQSTLHWYNQSKPVHTELKRRREVLCASLPRTERSHDKPQLEHGSHGVAEPGSPRLCARVRHDLIGCREGSGAASLATAAHLDAARIRGDLVSGCSVPIATQQRCRSVCSEGNQKHRSLVKVLVRQHQNCGSLFQLFD